MARTTAAKAAGLDLLDRLFRNQILVHLVFSEEEREWLARLCARVDELVSGAGLHGLEAERLRHWTYCMLEIYVADRWGTGLEHSSGAPAALPDLPLDTMRRISEHECHFFAAFGVAMTDSVHQASGAPSTARGAMELVEDLIEEFRGAPSVVRLRLAERALAFEFPAAPLEALQWLASVGVLKPAKYSATQATVPVWERLAVRAASLCEFETLRGSIVEQIGFEAPAAALDAFVRQMRDEVGAKEAHQVYAELLQMQAAQVRVRQGPATAQILVDPQWCFEPESAGSFLAGCHRLTPYLRTSLHKLSNAVTDIAAVLLVMQKSRMTPHRALYAAGSKRGTIADDVSSLLRTRGFAVDPKTIYRHVRSRVAAPLRVQTVYREMASHFGVAWPAYWPDIVRPMEIAHARTLPVNIRLELPDADRALH